MRCKLKHQEYNIIFCKIKSEYFDELEILLSVEESDVIISFYLNLFKSNNEKYYGEIDFLISLIGVMI